MPGKFELKKSTDAKFHFNLKAENDEVILSSEMYESKTAAENGIASVRKNAPDASKFERKTSEKNEPYFVLKAENNLVIGKSEMYSSNAAMENGIQSVMKNAPDALIEEATA